MRLYDIKVDEAFDSDVAGKITRATDKMFTTEATIGDRKIIFNALQYYRPRSYDPNDNTSDSVWEIEFIEKKPGKTTFAKTGSGSEMQVFSFVINSIKELITRYSPGELEFGAAKSDENRSKLYQRMIKRIKVPGYSALPVEPGDDADTFRIVRDDK